MRSTCHRRFVRLRRLVAAGVAVALAAGIAVDPRATPARAETGPVVVDAATLHGRLFAARVRAHADELVAVKILVLSGELLSWREQHPTATAAELTGHAATIGGVLDAQVKAEERAQSPDRRLLRLLALLAADDRAALNSPLMVRVLKVMVGADTLPLDTIRDFIRSRRSMYSSYDSTYVVQDLIWGEVAARAQQDATLAQVWNARFGTPLGISALESTDQLAADPLIHTVVDVPALLALVDDQDAFAAEAERQFAATMAALDGTADNAVLKQSFAGLNTAVLNTPAESGRPRDGTLAADLEQAAADRQKSIDGAGTAVQVISGMMERTSGLRWYGEQIATVGKAFVQIATAINKYAPAVAGLGFARALFSVSTAVMTGNVIGALSSLLPLFGGGRSPEDAMRADLRKLQASVDKLATTMTTRFDRVDRTLNALYNDLRDRFAEVINTQNITLERIKAIDGRLLALSTQLDAWGAQLTLAHQQEDLKPVFDVIDLELNWSKRNGDADMPYSRWYTDEGQLHEFATHTAQYPPYTIPATLDLDVLPVLDTYFRGGDQSSSIGGNGAVLYLHRHAGDYGGWQATNPQVTDKTPADSASWSLAARAYILLLAQNPQNARRPFAHRADNLIAEGNEILLATRAFSEPENGGTNRLFAGLTDAYRATAEQFSERLRVLQAPKKAQLTAGVNMFGTIDQLPAAQVPADPALVPNCKAGGAALSRPANVSTTSVPKEVYFADWASNDVSVVLCQSFSFTNVETTDNGKWLITSGDLLAHFELRMVWQGQLIPVRSWEKTWPLGEYCRQRTDGGAGGTCHKIDEYRNNWASTYRSSFEASATYTQADLTVRDRTRRWFYGLAADYYYWARQDLITPGAPLYDLNQQLVRQVRLLRAYTALGFARAMEQDELLPLLLTGAERLPADLRDDPMIGASLQKARDIYCPGNACMLTDQSYRPLTAPPYLDPAQCTAPGMTAHATGDPIGDCLLGNQLNRIGALRARYDAHSAERAAGVEEGMPEIEVTVQTLRVVRAVLRP